MNTIDCIKTRRSVRKFKDEQIKDDELIQVLEAGTWSERLRKMNAEVMGTTGDPYYGAPTIILVLTDRGYGNEVYDGSIVLQTMMLAAHEIGLGTCWIHREREMFDTEEGKQLLSDMGIQEDLMGIGALSIGYEAEGGSHSPKPRKADYYKIVK